ncbi:MAG: lysine exporter LysO family protein [Candidatus Delongbacteria bacterium]|nr:lysine exporter LysO family protein [Candidatus Delongbacteria bacterium]MBN2836456.1 lysine exporter LysO family protein [Candidatus Delongbacteria bacterium]
MKSSIKILLFFIIGVFVALLSKDTNLNKILVFIKDKDLTTYALYLLMFLVGIGVGGDTKSWTILKKFSFKIVLVPIATIIGSLFGGVLLGYFSGLFTIDEALAVSSGLGYYSLSSILITEIRSETLGVIALLSNILRELMTLILTPFFAYAFGKLAPIASGGATSMDTTLPIITRYVGKEYAMISVFSGTVLTLAVPILVPLMLKL